MAGIFDIPLRSAARLNPSDMYSRVKMIYYGF